MQVLAIAFKTADNLFVHVCTHKDVLLFLLTEPRRLRLDYVKYMFVNFVGQVVWLVWWCSRLLLTKLKDHSWWVWGIICRYGYLTWFSQVKSKNPYQLYYCSGLKFMFYLFLAPHMVVLMHYFYLSAHGSLPVLRRGPYGAGIELGFLSYKVEYTPYPSMLQPFCIYFKAPDWSGL